MADRPSVILDREREHAQHAVGEAYAREFLDQDEVDRRMEAIHSALSVEDLKRITEDLPSLENLPVSLNRPDTHIEVSVRPTSRLSAVLSSLERVGPWTLGPSHEVRVVLGSVTLDLRDVAWAVDFAEIHVDVILGSLEVIVPPGLAVDVDCTPIMSSIESQDTIHSGNDPALRRRRVRLSGRVILGSVSVRERFLGEGVAAAWWRRHRERRALGRGRLKALPPERSDDG